MVPIIYLDNSWPYYDLCPTRLLMNYCMKNDSEWVHKLVPWAKLLGTNYFWELLYLQVYFFCKVVFKFDKYVESCNFTISNRKLHVRKGTNKMMTIILSKSQNVKYVHTWISRFRTGTGHEIPKKYFSYPKFFS